MRSLAFLCFVLLHVGQLAAEFCNGQEFLLSIGPILDRAVTSLSAIRSIRPGSRLQLPCQFHVVRWFGPCEVVPENVILPGQHVARFKLSEEQPWPKS